MLEATFNPMVRRGMLDNVAMEAVVAAVLKPDSHTIDVGASTGDVLRHLLRVAPRGRHVAYEPIPHHARFLASHFPGVDVRETALSDSDGTSTFQYVVGRPAYSGLLLRPDVSTRQEPVQTLSVAVRRLDNDLPEDVHPKLMKIDVEGAEVRVLRGAVATLREYRPIILFEHGYSEIYGTSSADLWDILDDCGYRLFNSEGEGPYSREVFERSFQAPQWNYMGIPAG